MRSKAEMMAGLQRMLHDMFAARDAGVSHPSMARAQGSIDGAMRALLDSGHATRRELLDVVALERSRVSGPAVRELAFDPGLESVAA